METPAHPVQSQRNARCFLPRLTAWLQKSCLEWGPIWREGLSGRITNSIQIRVRLICSLKGEFNQGGSLVFISNATKFKGSANSICRRYTMFSNTSSKDGHWPVAWAMA